MFVAGIIWGKLALNWFTTYSTLHAFLAYLPRIPTSGPPNFQDSKRKLDLFEIVFIFIENADATPPHLDVFMRLGSPADVPGSLQFLCKGGAQPMHENTLPNRLECSAKARQNTNFGQPEGHLCMILGCSGRP